MPEVLELAFKPENGKMPMAVVHRLLDAVSQAGDKRLVVTLKVVERPRTLKQNRFYQGPFIDAFQRCLLDCGQRVSQEDIHEGLRDAHAKNGYVLMLPGNIPFRVPPSTRRLATVGFEEFLEEIRAEYAAKFGWQLPFPGESVE
jgi:hypothetical protein